MAIGERPCRRQSRSISKVADLLAAILRLTLPKGVGPFVEKLTALGSILDTDGARSDTVPSSKLRKLSTP